MTEPLDVSELLATEFERQALENQTRFDLRRFHEVAGKPKGRSPRSWAARLDLEPGVTAPATPREPVWGDLTTALEYAHYLSGRSGRIGPGWFSRPDLHKRGWTDTMIRDFLPTHDASTVNPTFKCSPRVRLYSVSRVDAIEASEQFQSVIEQSKGRRESSRKGVATKLRHTCAFVDEVTINVPSLDKVALIENACAHFNRRLPYDVDRTASPDSDSAFLERITVNYLRHQATPYDDHLDATKGKTGVGYAYDEINQKVYDAISEVYPELGAECDRQLSWKRSLSDLAAQYAPRRTT